MMKKCAECNVEMLEKYGIRPGEHASGYTKNFLYLVKEGDKHYPSKCSQEWIKCRICPKCGKIELYIEPSNIELN